MSSSTSFHSPTDNLGCSHQLGVMVPLKMAAEASSDFLGRHQGETTNPSLLLRLSEIKNELMVNTSHSLAFSLLQRFISSENFLLFTLSPTLKLKLWDMGSSGSRREPGKILCGQTADLGCFGENVGRRLLVKFWANLASNVKGGSLLVCNSQTWIFPLHPSTFQRSFIQRAMVPVPIQRMLQIGKTYFFKEGA